MSCVIDLASRRKALTSLKRLSHPAGVDLPFDNQSDADLIIPEVRCAISSGAYSAGVIGFLADAVRPGDRVLVVGAGLGVVSTLVARSRGVERVIAIEANTALTHYLMRVHALNGVPWVETVNAVLADGKLGRAPFFARRDPRTSSLLPDNGPWEQTLLVPCMDLNLILKEEQISLLICDIPCASAPLTAVTELGSVERILVNGGDNLAHYRAENEVRSLLAEQGFASEKRGGAALLERPGAEVWSVRA